MSRSAPPHQPSIASTRSRPVPAQTFTFLGTLANNTSAKAAISSENSRVGDDPKRLSAVASSPWRFQRRAIRDGCQRFVFPAAPDYNAQNARPGAQPMRFGRADVTHL